MHPPFVYPVVLEDASKSDRHDLLSELSIMKKLPPHRHVVRLLGCVTTSGILFTQWLKLPAVSHRNDMVFNPDDSSFVDHACLVETVGYRDGCECVRIYRLDRVEDMVEGPKHAKRPMNDSNWSRHLRPRAWSITRVWHFGIVGRYIWVIKSVFACKDN